MTRFLFHASRRGGIGKGLLIFLGVLALIGLISLYWFWPKITGKSAQPTQTVLATPSLPDTAAIRLADENDKLREENEQLKASEQQRASADSPAKVAARAKANRRTGGGRVTSRTTLGTKVAGLPWPKDPSVVHAAISIDQVSYNPPPVLLDVVNGDFVYEVNNLVEGASVEVRDFVFCQNTADDQSTGLPSCPGDPSQVAASDPYYLNSTGRAKRVDATHWILPKGAIGANKHVHGGSCLQLREQWEWCQVVKGTDRLLSLVRKDHPNVGFNPWLRVIPISGTVGSMDNHKDLPPAAFAIREYGFTPQDITFSLCFATDGQGNYVWDEAHCGMCISEVRKVRKAFPGLMGHVFIDAQEAVMKRPPYTVIGRNPPVVCVDDPPDALTATNPSRRVP